eukprot:IDg20325t1
MASETAWLHATHACRSQSIGATRRALHSRESRPSSSYMRGGPTPPRKSGCLRPRDATPVQYCTHAPVWRADIYNASRRTHCIPISLRGHRPYCPCTHRGMIACTYSATWMRKLSVPRLPDTDHSLPHLYGCEYPHGYQRAVAALYRR